MINTPTSYSVFQLTDYPQCGQDSCDFMSLFTVRSQWIILQTFFISADQANSSVNIQYKITGHWGFSNCYTILFLIEAQEHLEVNYLGKSGFLSQRTRVPALQQFALHYNVCQ